MLLFIRSNKNLEKFKYSIYVDIRMVSNSVKKGNAKLTLSINEKILNEYKKYCDKMGIIISKQVEKFMEEQLKNEKNKS